MSRTSRIKIDLKKLEKACELSQSNDEVAKRLGISESSVARLCSRHNIMPPYKRRHKERKDKSFNRGNDFFYNHNTGVNPKNKLTKMEKIGKHLWKIATQPKAKRLTPEEYHAKSIEEKKQRKRFKNDSDQRPTGEQYLRTLQEKTSQKETDPAQE